MRISYAIKSKGKEMKKSRSGKKYYSEQIIYKFTGGKKLTNNKQFHFNIKIREFCEFFEIFKGNEELNLRLLTRFPQFQCQQVETISTRFLFWEFQISTIWVLKYLLNLLQFSAPVVSRRASFFQYFLSFLLNIQNRLNLLSLVWSRLIQFRRLKNIFSPFNRRRSTLKSPINNSLFSSFSMFLTQWEDDDHFFSRYNEEK